MFIKPKGCNDELEFLEDENTGRVYCNARGYSRLSGLPVEEVSARMADKIKPFVAGVGFIDRAELDLLDEETIESWLEIDNPTLVKQLGSEGIRPIIHNIVYRPHPKPTAYVAIWNGISVRTYSHCIKSHTSVEPEYGY